MEDHAELLEQWKHKPMRQFLLIWEQVEPGFVPLGEVEVRAPNLHGALQLSLKALVDFPRADSLTIQMLGA